MLVDAPKSIQIDDGDRDRRAPGFVQCAAQGRAEGGAIHETGERVFIGQLPDGLVAGLYRRLHELQPFGEHSEFVGPLHAQAPIVGAGAHLIDGLRQVLQRPRDIAREPESGQGGRDQADRGDQEQYLGQAFERRSRVRQRPRQNRDDFGVAPLRHFDAPGDDVGRARAAGRHRAHHIRPMTAGIHRERHREAGDVRQFARRLGVELEAHGDPGHRQGAAHRHGDELVNSAVVDHQAGRAVAGHRAAFHRRAALHRREGKRRARVDVQTGGGNDVAVERGQHHHGGADALPAILQNRDQRIGVAARDRFAKSIVGGDRLRRLGQLAAVAFQQTREYGGADVELALYLVFSIAAIRRRYRAQRGGQHSGQQQQESYRNAGTQRHGRLSGPRRGHRNQHPECDSAHRYSR